MIPIVHMKLFKPGTVVSYKGWDYTVAHVMITSRRLMVSLVGLDDMVDSEQLSVQPTQLDFNRPKYD